MTEERPRLRPFADLLGDTISIITNNWQFFLKVGILVFLTSFFSVVPSIIGSSISKSLLNLQETKPVRQAVMNFVPGAGVLGSSTKAVSDLGKVLSSSREDLYKKLSEGETPNVPKGILAGIGVIVLLILLPLILAGAILGMWSQTTLLEGVRTKVWGESAEVSECYKVGFKKIWGFFATSFVYGIVVFLGFLLLIIPGIIFALWYGEAPLVFMVEGKRGISALKRSKELITGRILAVFGREFLFGLLLMLVMAPIWGISALFSGFGAFGALLVAILGGLVSVFATTAGFTFNLLILKNLIETTPVPST